MKKTTALTKHKGSTLEFKEKRRKELAIKRNQQFAMVQQDRYARNAVKLYQEKNQKVRAKYTLHKDYLKNIVFVFIVAVALGVLGVSHEEVRHLAYLLMGGCGFATLVTYVQYKRDKETNQKTDEVKDLLIKNEVEYELKKDLVHIKQHFEQVGYKFPELESNPVNILEKQKLLN